jgi:archaellum biogenesis ATPase FlaH
MSKLTQAQIAKALQATPSSKPVIEVDDVNLDVSLEELDNFGDKESIKEMYTSVKSYNKMLGEKITFVNKALTAAVPFTRENLYLMCGYSGNGKSTIAANISYPLWKEGKKTLVISNEEPKQDIIYRIACLELGYNFNDYKKGLMPQSQQIECMKLYPEICKFVKVVDVNFNNGISSTLEGIKNILTQVESADYSAVMIDYFQQIKKSVVNPNRSGLDVLTDLRMWLGRYIRKSNIPVVLFAQLHSLGKRNNQELDSRIKDCPSVYEPSTVVVEIIPDFENKTTKFIIKKDRFGYQGMKIECAFDKGRYIEITAAHLEKAQQAKIDMLLNKAGIEGEDEDM